MSDPRPVQFTYESAERIANAVRAVETAPRPASPLVFEQMPVVAQNRKVFRMATFTGAWSIGSIKTVTLQGSTATLAAMNQFFPVTNTAAGNRACAVAKDGTAWYLVDVRVAVNPVSVVSGFAINGSLNTANCSVSIFSTAYTASVSSVAYGV